MCGIAGFQRADGKSAIPDSRRLAIAALIAIADRGPDSTGAAWTRGKAESVWYAKLPGSAPKVAGDLPLDRNLRTCILHTRWATQGAVDETNAHPLLAEGARRSIVLTHNGVISNDDDLAKLAAIERVGEVDSWAIAALLATQDEHPADLLDLVEGDAALAWLDTSDPGSLHLARLRGRPLVLAWTRRGDLVYASTRAALERISRMCNLHLSHFIHVEEGTYLRIVASDIVERRDVKAFVRPPVKLPVQRPPTKGSPAPKRQRATPRRGYAHGITDLFDDASWEESLERRLIEEWSDGNDWPTGEEIVRQRPKNDAGW